MPNTIQAHELASIDTSLLADVQGGCGKKRRGCCNNTVINNIQQAPSAAPPPPPPSGTAVDVNVGYQQQG
jgi:hypothetical protein